MFPFYTESDGQISKRSRIIVAVAPLGIASLAIDLFKVGYFTTFFLYSYMLLCNVFLVLGSSFQFLALTACQSYHTVLKCTPWLSAASNKRCKDCLETSLYSFAPNLVQVHYVQQIQFDNEKGKLIFTYIDDAAVDRADVFAEDNTTRNLILPTQHLPHPACFQDPFHYIQISF